MAKKSAEKITQERFTKNEDGTIVDHELGITWLDTLPGTMSWADAKRECEKLGCRLPTDKELESLIDRSRYNPAIIKGAEILNLKTDDWYWTETEHASWSGSAWIVRFKNGNVDFNFKDGSSYVRPVRPSK